MKIFITLCLFITISTGYSQNLGLNYYATGAGRNLTATYSVISGGNEFGVGLGYNINRIIQPDDQSNIYYRRLFATTPAQHLNFNLFYNRYIFKHLKHIRPLVFYDLQLKYATTRSSMYTAAVFDSSFVSSTPDEKLLYRKYIENFGPFLWWENSIGIGFRVDITDRWYLNQKVGLGIHLIHGEGRRVFKPKWEWEFHTFANLGVGYVF